MINLPKSNEGTSIKIRLNNPNCSVPNCLTGSYDLMKVYFYLEHSERKRQNHRTKSTDTLIGILNALNAND